MRSLFFFLFMSLSTNAFAATASWYSSADSCGPKTNNHKGCPTASGKSLYVLEEKGIDFAASNSYPIGTSLNVCGIDSGRCVTVKVLDRGGFGRYGRSIDLGKGSFAKISSTNKGLAKVTITKL
jgi:rare lipoprotein A